MPGSARRRRPGGTGRIASVALAVLSAAAAALLVPAATMPVAAAAATGTPRLTVSPASGVPLGGGTVTVTGSGFATEGNGVYVAWCRVVPQYWTSADNCADARWVHSGASGAGQVPLSAAGGFSTQLAVTPRIGTTSCLTAGKCAVLTMAAHGSSDRSQDTFAAVTFAPAPATSRPRSSTPTPPPAPTRKPAATTPASAHPDRSSAGATRSADPTRAQHRRSPVGTTAPGIALTAATTDPNTGSVTDAATAGPATATDPDPPTPTASLVAAGRAEGAAASGGSPAWAVAGVAAVLVAAAAGTGAVALVRRRNARPGH